MSRIAYHHINKYDDVEYEYLMGGIEDDPKPKNYIDAAKKFGVSRLKLVISSSIWMLLGVFIIVAQNWLQTNASDIIINFCVIYGIMLLIFAFFNLIIVSCCLDHLDYIHNLLIYIHSISILIILLSNILIILVTMRWNIWSGQPLPLPFYNILPTSNVLMHPTWLLSLLFLSMIPSYINIDTCLKAAWPQRDDIYQTTIFITCILIMSSSIWCIYLCFNFWNAVSMKFAVSEWTLLFIVILMMVLFIYANFSCFCMNTTERMKKFLMWTPPVCISIVICCILTIQDIINIEHPQWREQQLLLIGITGICSQCISMIALMATSYWKDNIVFS